MNSSVKENNGLDIRQMFAVTFGNQLSLSTGGDRSRGNGSLPVYHTRLVDLSTKPDILPLDPETISLILEGISFVISLFGDDNTEEILKKLDEIGDWIQKVDEKLHMIGELLVQIQEALVELQVYIDRKFAQDAEYNVRALCQTYVTNVEALKADRDSEDLRKLFANLYPQLQTESNKLRLYGYASITTVFYAFRIELDLVRFLGFRRITPQIASNYSDYFAAALDPTITGSLENALRSTVASMEKLERDFAPGSKGRVANSYFYKDNEHTVCRGREHECTTLWDFYRFNPDYKITGSVASGFEVSLVENENTWADSSHPDRDYAIGRDAVMAKALEWARENVLPDYKKASNRYNTLKENRQTLEKLIPECRKMVDRAEGIRDAARAAELNADT